MSKLPQLLVLFFSLWLAACGGEAVDPKGEITADEKEQPTIIMPEPDMLEAGKTLYAWVDRLNIRETPDLKAKVIANVSSQNPLLFTGNKSELMHSVLLRGVVYEDYWLEVKTPDDSSGWVFGGAVKMAGEEKGNSPFDPEYLQFPYFGTFDLSQWKELPGSTASGGDATTETTVYERGGQTLTITFTDVGEYGYSYSYVLAEGSETLRTRVLDFSADMGLLLTEKVVDYQQKPVVEYERTQQLKQHPMFLGGKPIMAYGDWEERKVMIQE
jgi:hypothetical protein